MLENIKWLGQSGFKINSAAGKTIYLDPYKIPVASPKADYIFITHSHYDHFSAENVAKIRGENTQIFCPGEVASKVGGQVRTVKPGDSFSAGDLKIEVFPAYNMDKEFHPKENGWVGYVLEIDGQRIYHAGDTDLIPEMNDLKDIDIALLPVSGTYVMTSEEAIEAAKIIKPKTVIPMHYGDEVGTVSDAMNLKDKVEAEVIILEKEV